MTQRVRIEASRPSLARRWHRAAPGAAAFLLLLVFCAPCLGARIVPLEGSWQAACLTERHTTLVRVRVDGSLEQSDLRSVLQVVTDGPAWSLLGFKGREIIQIDAHGVERALAPAPEPVRDCLKLSGDVYLLLLGGRWAGGELREARAVLWSPARGTFTSCRQVLPWWDPFALSTAGGDGQGEQRVLVAVRKTAPFDPIRRRRPFLFGFHPGNADLVPLWKGTSVAHPHLAARLACLGSQPEAQLCAVEELTEGRRVLTAYEFTGRMQLIASTGPAPFGRQLEVMPGARGAGDLLIAALRVGTKWSVAAYGADSLAGPGAVGVLRERLRTSLWEAAPVAWSVVAGPGGHGVLSLHAGGNLAYYPLRDCRL